MMTYRLMTSDLDETLLRADGSVSEENVRVIKTFVAAGGYFVPNTGRSFDSVVPLLRKLGLATMANQYTITNNGAVITQNADRQLLMTRGMPYEEVAGVFSVMQQFDVAIHIYTLDQLYIYRPRVDDQAYLKTRGVQYTQLMKPGQVDQFKQRAVLKVIAMNPDIAVRQAIQRVLQTRFDGKINCTFSSGMYIETNHFGVDKGSAVLALGRKLGVEPQEMIAIGDNSNDLAMLKVVGLPVSVSNGIPAIQQIADYVTQANFETGVAETLNRFAVK